MPDLRCVIADDEPAALKHLKLHFQSYEDIDIVAECRNGFEALSAIQETEPDLVFLDIEMPGLGGFEVVKRLQAEVTPPVIFVTAFNQYAIRAFDIHAVDYVLKPLNADRLKVAISRARQRLENEKAMRASNKANVLRAIGRIPVKDETDVWPATEIRTEISSKPDSGTLQICDSGQTHEISHDEIDWIDAAGDYMCIHVGSRTLVARMTMESLEKQLSQNYFVRIHRSTIVNVRRVMGLTSLGNGDLSLSIQGGSQLRASRRYSKKLKRVLSLI
jgi:two-component system LytT family response regulator